MNKSKLLVYTYANKNYYPFAVLYQIFFIQKNPDADVEIIIENYNEFYEQYKHLLDFYKKYYPNVYFHQIDKNIKSLPGTTRFITTPIKTADYIYIGDIDIFICENILRPHLKNIKDNNLDFSNIKRKNEFVLSGLHFIKYDKMYPVKIPSDVNLETERDESVLYKMMLTKGYKIPDENKHTFRPLLGLHASYYSRPPLPTLTTKDCIVKNFPSWFTNTDPKSKDKGKKYAKQYLKLRYSKPIKKFMQHIKYSDIELRKIIQNIDIVCWYYKKN